MQLLFEKNNGFFAWICDLLVLVLENPPMVPIVDEPKQNPTKSRLPTGTIPVEKANLRQSITRYHLRWALSTHLLDVGFLSMADANWVKSDAFLWFTVLLMLPSQFNVATSMLMFSFFFCSSV